MTIISCQIKVLCSWLVLKYGFSNLWRQSMSSDNSEEHLHLAPQAKLKGEFLGFDLD